MPGKHPHRRVHLKAEPNAKPVHSKPCSATKTHKQVFNHKLEHLRAIGALERCGAAEWVAPTLIVPKKDGFLISRAQQSHQAQDLSFAQNPRHFEQTERT
jgi:hypothetical protein